MSPCHLPAKRGSVAHARSPIGIYDTEIAVVEGLDYLTRVSVDDVVADLMSKLVIACTDPVCHFAVSCFKGIIPVLDDLSSAYS
jgi:hypothetical protein